MAKTFKTSIPCPCGGTDYVSCCQVWHQGTAASSPELLMRSRYSAYALGLHDYVLDTWHPSTRPATLDDDAQDERPRWQSLKIYRSEIEPSGESGLVEFLAIYKINGRAYRLHEVSRFVRQESRWYYLNGEFPDKIAS